MGHFMFDTFTTALLRAGLDEVCESVPRRESGVRTHVAAKIMEAATRGEVSPEGLKQGTKLSRKRRPCGADRASRG